MKAKARAPIVKELHFTEQVKKEIKRIRDTEPITRKKEMIRNIIGGPMCSVCSELPTKRIYYNLQGVTRIEAYCDEHFSTYLKQKDIDIDSIMKEYNCTRAPPNMFGGSKVEKQKQGYNLTPKSSNSMSSDSTVRCNRCGFRIRFSEDKRGPQGGLIPLDMAGQIHNCGITMSFPCRTCNEQIYLDAKVLSPTNKRIPLSAIDSRPHDCWTRSERNRNVDDV